ncbi:SMI1/KNR4 family protein [Myroides sp. LJL116]
MNNTMVKEEFTALFKGYSIPKDLKSLLEFQLSETIPSYYSNAIYLIDEDPELIESFSNETEFVNSFIPFAEADSNGSVYAFWIKDSNEKNLDQMPIVVFGDEGGVFPVASNLKELLQIAAYDVEPSIFEDEFSFSDREILEEEGEYVATEFNKEYLDWLRNDAKLKPILIIDDVDVIVNRANDTFSKELNSFLDKFKS